MFSRSVDVIAKDGKISYAEPKFNALAQDGYDKLAAEIKRARYARRLLATLLCIPALAVAQQRRVFPVVPLDPAAAVPALGQLVARPSSDVATIVERYVVDARSLIARFDARKSPDQRKRLRDFNNHVAGASS